MSAPKLVARAAQFLPYGRQAIDEADIAAVAGVLRSDYLTTGPAVEAFENAFAACVQAPHAIACANGTAGLHLAMLALDIGPGDQVIVPTITFLATANAARFCGADVVFCDVDPDTALMTPQTLMEAFDRAPRGRVKAVIAVHYAGAPCDLSALASIAHQQGAALVEDACHALGSTTPQGPIGAAHESAMAVFSFHPVKTIATGEGAMITTRNGAIAKRLALLRAHAMERPGQESADPEISADADGAPAPWAYEMHKLGYNYRLSDMQAALGASQLKKLSAFRSRRRALLSAYARALAPLAPLAAPMAMGPGTCPHLMVALLDFAHLAVTRGAVMNRLREAGVGTQVHYIPVHRQPYYRGLYGDLSLPGAEDFYRRCLSLPLYPLLEETDVARVVEALARALER